MEITSHFISIKINTSPFVDLFVNLQRYLDINDLISSIALRDIHSLHITLYYLPKEISPEELDAIQKNISDLTSTYKNFSITSGDITFFTKNNLDSLCYITCPQADKLKEINSQLATQYKKNEIIDNQYNYIPHMLLFKILDQNLFIKHKDTINNIIKQDLQKISNANLFQGFFLFEVNSNFHPEIQLIKSSIE